MKQKRLVSLVCLGALTAFCLAKVVGAGIGERWWAWGVAIIAAVVPLAAVSVGFYRWDSLGSRTQKSVRRAGELLPFAALAAFPVVAGLPDAWQMAYWSLPVGLFAWFLIYGLRLDPEASSP
jgi:hypothetical protein